MPALSNVAITDTFDTWRVRTNQLILKSNEDELISANAYIKANSANYYASLVDANTTAAFDKANSVNYYVSLVDANTVSAFDKANSANYYASLIDANTKLAYNKANTANYFAFLVDANTSAAFDRANTIYVVANTASNTGIAAYNFSNTVNTIAVASFAKANAALPNTSGAVFSGNLSITGTLGVGTTTPSANLDVVGTVTTAKANVLSQTLTDGATITWDTSLGQIATVTLGGNRTMAAPTNLKIGTYILHVIQDGTGGRTLTWNAVFKWPAASAPVLTTTANRRDLFSFVSDGTNLYGSFLPDVR